MVMYVNANKGYLPFGTTANANWSVSLATILKRSGGTVATTETADTTFGRAVFLDKDTAEIGSTARNHYASHPLAMPEHTANMGAANPLGLPAGTRVPYKLVKIRPPTDKILLFDATQVLYDGTTPKGGTEPVGKNIDNNRAAGNAAPAAPKTFLMTPHANSDDGSPIDAGVNKDVPDGSQPDPNKAEQNFRFRHLKNTTLNAFMADGHVQSFRYKNRNSSEILRSNINLPRP